MSLPTLEGEPALREALRLIDDQRFEELVHALVREEFPNAKKLDAPDLGADTLVDTPDDVRVWQAKHFTANISWPQCVKSRDRALQEWSPNRITFVFSRNLTGNQEKLFRKHLEAGLPDGMTVDWWGTSELLTRLLAPNGLAIARRFLNFRPQADLQLAIQANARLNDGQSILSQANAIGRFAATQDPDYDYAVSSGPAHLEPPPTKTLRLEHIGDGQRSMLEAFPRFPGSVDPMQGTITFHDSDEGRAAAARLGQAFARGGEVDLQGATVNFSGLPAAFRDVIGDGPLEGATLTVGRSTWPAKWTIAGPEGIHELELDFVEGDSPDVRTASRGGLTVTLTLEGAGVEPATLNVQWKYAIETLPGSDELAIVDFIRALKRGGTAQLASRTTSDLKPLVVQVPARESDAFLEELSSYLTALRRIERRTGITFVPQGDALNGRVLFEVAEADAVLRRGTRLMEVQRFQCTLSPVDGGDIEAFVRGLERGEIVVNHQLLDEFTIYGQPVSLGIYQIPVPPGRIASSTPTPGDPTSTDFTFVPDTDKRSVKATLLGYPTAS